MAVATMSLRPDRKLLDPQFEGYKLSLDPLPTYRHSITSAICQAEQTDSQFSLQHFRIFGLHNRLYTDPWYENYLYYVTERQFINQIKFNNFGFEESHVVLHIPNDCYLTGEYNESIHFTSTHQLVISDGRGTLYLVMTDDRSSSQQWKIAFSIVIEREKNPFHVVHSRLTPELEIDCLLLNAEDGKDIGSRKLDDKKNQFLTILTWITLATDANGVWSLKHKRQLAGVGPVDFAALKDNSIMIVSGHKFDFIYDSCKPIEKEEVIPDEIEPKARRYTWNQTEDDVTITFDLANTSLKKEDVQFDISLSHLNLSTTDDSITLQGDLFDKVDLDNCTWTITDETLKIVLMKSNIGLQWQTLMIGDTDRSDLPENSMKNKNPLFDANPPFDPNQLEECDAYPSDFFNLSIYDSETHKISTQINLSGNQWLFSVILTADKLPAFCIRHDVDGIIWQPEDGNKFTHMLTLNALGYVQASKQDRKFSTCSPNGAFAVVCDSRRHLYVYHRPNAVASQIRNRQTGKQIGSVARQQVINLDSSDEIIGIHASTNNIFVLTKNTLFAIHVEIDV